MAKPKKIEFVNKVVEFKLVLSKAQRDTLNHWLKTCCWVYNHMLSQKKKAWQRRKESLSKYTQQKLLAIWRSRISSVRDCPSLFCRDAIQRIDLGYSRAYERIKLGDKPGFPRFKKFKRYSSMKALQVAKYLHGNKIHIPIIGKVRAYGRKDLPSGQQCSLTIIKRPDGWYAQIVFREKTKQAFPSGNQPVGIDFGIKNIAALSDGTFIANPKFSEMVEPKIKSLQRELSKKTPRSNNWYKSKAKLEKISQKITLRRRAFAHQHTTDLVKRYGLIAIEKLNMAKMLKTRLAKSILDAGWGQFIRLLKHKAEEAGVKVIEVNPAYTSQTCPDCGARSPKKLSDRLHSCTCGCVLDRDTAASRVILSLAASVSGGNCGGGASSVSSQARNGKLTQRSRKTNVIERTTSASSIKRKVNTANYDLSQV